MSTPKENPEENPQLTPEEERRAENEIAAALFDAEHGSMTHLAADLPPEVFQQFLANVKAYEERSADLVPVRELLGDTTWPDGTKIQSVEEGEQAIAKVEALLREHRIETERPAHLSPAGYYFFLTQDLMDHPVVPPLGDTRLLVHYDDIRQDGPAFMADVAEQFLLMLWDLSQPFDPLIFAEQVRLGQEAVSPERALGAVNGWRGQFQSITPGACTADGPLRGPDGATYFQCTVSYTTVDTDGQSETLEGPGVIQLAMNPGERFWRVAGAAVPGFEL